MFKEENKLSLFTMISIICLLFSSDVEIVVITSMKGAEIKLRKLVQDSNQIFREILPPTILIKFLVVTRLTKNSEKSVTEIQKMVTNQNGPPETWMKTVKLSIKDICSSKPISKSKVEITKQNKNPWIWIFHEFIFTNFLFSFQF